MSALDPRPASGSCFKFTVCSADEAVTVIRERLGANARVLSVRSVEAKGLRKFFTSPRLEVVAQVDAPADAVISSSEPVAAHRTSTAEVSSEPALPVFAESHARTN